MEQTTSGCGIDIGCYRHPSGCLPDDCEFLLTFRPEGDLVEFNVSASIDNGNTLWTAVGFSTDKNMVHIKSFLFPQFLFLSIYFLQISWTVQFYFQDLTSVTDCIYNSDNDTMIIQQSWNVAGWDNEVLSDVSSFTKFR